MRDASVGAPVFFADFDDEDAALAATTALLRRGYRVEITPPSWEMTRWHLAAAGWPEAGSVQEAYELLREWVAAAGGGSSGYQSGDDAIEDVFGSG